MPLRIEEIGDLGALGALRPAWEALWARTRDATPFSNPAWLLPWCHAFFRADLWAIACWRDGVLVALAPTFVYPDARGRVLGLLGGGLSDYQDIVAEDVEAAAAIVAHLAARGDRFDVADLQSLPRQSKLLAAAAQGSVAYRVGPEAPVAILPLPASLPELATRTSRSLLREVRYQRRRLEREGGIVVSRVQGRDDIPCALEDFYHLHGARWRARGEAGVVAAAGVRRFHREAAAGLLEAGLLRLFTLRAKGVPIAAWYGMAAHGRCYAYLFGTDPAEARRSPGSLVVAQAVEDAIAEGAVELDFLRGQERYKARWGAIAGSTLRLQLRPRGDVPLARPDRRAEQERRSHAWWPWSS